MNARTASVTPRCGVDRASTAVYNIFVNKRVNKSKISEDFSKEQDTRQEILDVARGLFRKYGLDKTTMSDIAGAMGKVKGGLYYYFPTKEDLFYAVGKLEMEEVFAFVSRSLASKTTAAEKLKTFFVLRCNKVRDTLAMYPVLLQDSGKHLALFRRLGEESLAREIEITNGIMETGINDGEFLRISPEERGRVVRAIILLMRGIDSNHVVEGKVNFKDMYAGTMTDIFLRGLKKER